MAGIETNPGPSKKVWKCSVCGEVLRGYTTSVKCNGCNEWCHLRPCSGLTSHRLWNTNFTAECCTTNTQLPTPPTPTQPVQSNTSTSVTSFKIMQLNCNGLRGKADEIIHFMGKNDIRIAALQETKLNSKVNIQIDGFTLVRCDRERDKGGGLAFIIDNKVKFRVTDLPTANPTDPYLEQQAITISSDASEITLINIYIPPSSSCPPAHAPDIDHLLTFSDSIILGDFNAHHPSWFSAVNEDARGTALAELIDASDFGTLNEDTPTRSASGTISSPDVTIASSTLLPCLDWFTLPALSSDHLPIIVELQKTVTKIKSECKTFTNFNKANWTGFREHTERKFAIIRKPKNIHKAERVFRGVIKRAAKMYIPAGRIRELRPNFPTNAATLADERDHLRSTDPLNPRVQQLTQEINKMVNDHKRTKWHEHLESSTLTSGTSNLWKTIKKLSNPKKNANNISISFDGTHAKDEKRTANNFNRMFTTHPNSTDKSTRGVIRSIHKLSPADENNFEEQHVAAIIKSTKPSKALGPDGISPIMLKHIGTFGITFLTYLMNLSLSTLLIPGVWKVGRVIPLLKPNKPEDQGKSYRPISLLSPIAKIVESLLLPTLSEHLPLAAHQHGFRKGHSTTTALHLMTDKIQRGLNQRRPNHRTTAVALDLSRAFDTVNHGVLLREMLGTTIPPRIMRWFANYLRGRQTVVEFRGATSKYRKLKQGVPQGGVLSPLLFNFYMSTLPPPPEDIDLISYADDITLLCTSNDVDAACEKINNYLRTLNLWLESRNLELSPGKSTATLFTTWTKEVSRVLDIKVGGHTIPTVSKPRILGVIFDNLMTFSAHAKNIKERLQGRNNVLKSLAGSTWGKDKETLITTYKAIGRSVINYAAPIWSPQLSDTMWQKLQISQNAALRSATGCHLMSSQGHIHAETKMLPIRAHNEMLSQQYLLRCHLPEHPCNATTTETPPPRAIKKSLIDAFNPVVATHIPPSGLDQNTYKNCIKQMHTNAVSDATANHLNPILNTVPPTINDEEKLLPRKTRATLAQLRSGWCRLLNHYRTRLDPDVPDVCPDCGTGPHDTRHLFECPSKPTPLGVESLWTRPKEAAAFLNLEDDEGD